jgi:hypothetical protein
LHEPTDDVIGLVLDDGDVPDAEVAPDRFEGAALVEAHAELEHRRVTAAGMCLDGEVTFAVDESG